MAPQARLAIYKACWTAPDPADDGCSTADLVTAVDRAVGDGVDVLNLSVGGSGEYDVLERALLGAAESDVVVVTAAGAERTVAHPAPWVLSVGATTGTVQRGALRLGRTGPVLEGAMLSSRRVDSTRLVRGADAAAPGSSRQAARFCRPGSLDDRRVRDAIVVCERGEIGRVDKSAAVERAGGAAMVLLNVSGRDDTFADLHGVPTVHLKRELSRQVLRWLRTQERPSAQIRSLGTSERPARVLARSASGDPESSVLKPDLVAAGAGLLSATTPQAGQVRWDFLTGTSGAAAQVSGLAAVLRGRHGYSATRIRSLLSTSTESIAADPLRAGAGEARRRVRPGLVFDVAPEEYRQVLRGDLGRALNTPSVMFGASHGTAVRRITNVSGRTRTFNASLSGFHGPHTVRVSPTAMTLRPGQTRSFEVIVTGDRARTARTRDSSPGTRAAPVAYGCRSSSAADALARSHPRAPRRTAAVGPLAAPERTTAAVLPGAGETRGRARSGGGEVRGRRGQEAARRAAVRPARATGWTPRASAPCGSCR